MRQFLLLLVLTIVTGGVAKGQASIHTKVYPIPGAADGAVGEFETPEQLKVLDDFIASQFLVKYDQAIMTNDREAFDRMIADNAIYVAERFGKGENFTKAQVLASFGSKKVVQVQAHTRDHVRLRVFGDNTVVMSGNSTSVLHYQGQVSSTTRLFAIVHMKLDGRWQVVLHSIMDYQGQL